MSIKRKVLKSVLLLAFVPLTLFLYLFAQGNWGELTKEEYMNAALTAGVVFVFVLAGLSYKWGFFAVQYFSPNASIWVKRLVGALFVFLCFAVWLSVV